MNTITPQELDLQTQFTLPQRSDWRIGVIGLGGISRAHLSAYRSMGWQVVAAAEIDRDRARKAQQQWSIPRLYDRYEDLIADPEVEVISLLTHPTLREPVVRAAAEVGKPLQTEKPLGDDLEQCERMVRRMEEQGVPFAVSQNYRWHPAVFFARQIIERGLIGTPYFASIEIHGTQDVELAGHDFYAVCDDFLTVQWNTHLADLLRCFVGRDAKKVMARTGRMNGQNFRSDNLLISIADYGAGCTGHVLHNELLRSGMQRNECRVEGDRGSLVFSVWGTELILDSQELADGPRRLEFHAGALPNSFCGPIGDFLASVESGREPTISARRNLATLRQVIAEHRSAQAGGVWVEIEGQER